MKYLPIVFFHLLPIIPAAFGAYYLAIATLLLVALAYIKVFKLRTQADEFTRRHGKCDPGLIKALVFWERLTFLKPRESDERESTEQK